MINGIEGIPGSGKSFEAVVYHVLPALEQGRKVITNLPLLVEEFVKINPAYARLIEVRTEAQPIRGTWDATNIAKEPAFRIDDKAEPRRTTLPVFAGVWDYYTTWKGAGGIGPLFVIDECHVVLDRTPDDREQLTAQKQVVEWFRLSRHFGVDVLLISQSFRDMNQTISRLLATLIRCRKADILGKEDEYIRKVYAGYRGAILTTSIRKYLPEYFKLYKSHSQGGPVREASLQDVNNDYSKWMKARRLVIIGLPVMLLAIYLFWSSLDGSKKEEKHAKKAPVQQQLSRPIPQESPVPVLHSTQPLQQQTPEPELPPEPPQPEGLYDGYKVHVTGNIVMGGRAVTTFVVSDGSKRLFELTSADLEKAGYTYEPLGNCAGWLRLGTRQIAATCDAPAMQNGSNERPLLIDTGTGARSDGRPLY